jgi:hypothetical protein
MRLLRLSEVEIGPNDRVFRHPRIPALIVWLGLFCGAAAMFFYALAGKWKPGYVFGPDLYLDPLGAAAPIQNLGRHPFEFYRKVGFVIAGVLPDANGFGKPDIFMAKRVQNGA